MNTFRALTAVLMLMLAGCRSAPAVAGASAAVGDLTVRDAVAWGLESSHSTTIGFRATATTADTLVGVESADGMAMLHHETDGQMVPLERLPLDAGATVVVGGGGPHIMLTGATHGYAPGDSVRLVLSWARSGRVSLRVPLVRFSDAATLLGR